MNIAELPKMLSCVAYKERVIRTLTRKQKNRCYLCHKHMDDPRRSHWKAPAFPTIDHWLPQSRGGTDDIDNLRLCCRQCNIAKGATLPAGLVWRGKDAAGLRGGLEAVAR